MVVVIIKCGLINSLMRVSEQPIRIVVAAFGLALLGIGVVATFSTENGAGAAALITAGVAMAVGSLIWDKVKSLTLGGTGFTKYEQTLSLANTLEAAGEEEAAEEIREGVVADLAPSAIEPRDWREAIESAVVDAIHETGAGVSYQELTSRQTADTLRLDLTFKTPKGLTIGVDVLVTRQAHNARVGAQRRIDAAARSADALSGYILFLASPDPDVSTYIAEPLTRRLEEWIHCSSANLALAIKAIDDLTFVDQETRLAISAIISQVDR